MSTKLIPIAISSQLDVTGEEKIHAANYEPTIRTQWSAPLFNIYSNILGESILLYSEDGGASFTETIDTGGLIGPLQLTASAGERLFRLSNFGRCMVSTDGINFVACSGITVSEICGVLYTGTEWLVYGQSNNLSVSSDAQSFSNRAMGAVCTSMAQYENTILGTSTSNNLFLSTDSGVSFSTINTGSSALLNRIVHNGSRFIVGGSDTFGFSGIIQYSDTGLAGSWNLSSGYTGDDIRRLACNPSTGRIVAVDSTGTSFYSDDGAETWTTGGTVPHTIPHNSQDNYMIFSNGKFFLNPNPVENSSFIYSSPDSISWTLVFDSEEAYNLGNLTAFMV